MEIEKSVKFTWAHLAAFAAGLVAISSALNAWILPGVLEKADARFRLELDRRMEAHASHIHDGAATEIYVSLQVQVLMAELRGVTAQLSDVKDQLRIIDNRLRELERIGKENGKHGGAPK